MGNPENLKETIFAVENGIATLTLNRPKIRNVITSAAMIDEIESVCRHINQDLSIKVLIVTGKDPAFSAGGNIKDMAAKGSMFQGSPIKIMENYRKYVQRIPLAVHHVEVPTIAAVNGPAIGAGCDLALMCDMRVASQKALFGETFLNLGLIPGDGGAYFLPRSVGMARACEMTFTGRTVTGEEAFSWGLVNDCVAHDQLMETTLTLARKIAAKPPEALRMAKRLLYMGQKLSLSQLLEQSASYQALCHQTADHLEAVQAMLQKRSPRFTGE